MDESRDCEGPFSEYSLVIHQGGDLVYVGGQKDISYVDLDRLSAMGIVEVLKEISYVTNAEHVLFRVPWEVIKRVSQGQFFH